ncbi:GMC family oxidoreductase [Mycobacterium sp.]|uniref:GMC oxidoreductase n=1 Tax=Mycobacterium sp. TaxID=1785 RepID=UPI0025D9FEDA|nr:GMC family oxidoreductase [Mycobacterium sp.]MBW0015774.1 GMC family oxidoreductase [Mycobacterium sp.]
MPAAKAIIVGSGAGGSTVAMELAENGWDVVIFEKGSNYYTNLDGTGPLGTTFSNDELKALYRYFEQPDPIAYPRTFRPKASQPASYVGPVNELPVTVGGGTTHWDAKVPRFWDIDFKGLSLLGPQPGADVQDWPFEYGEIAPYYDAIEALLGTQGDVGTIPTLTLKHAPRSRPFPMPPGPQQRSSMLIAKGAKRVGLHPYPFPTAINSVEYDGRPACNNCGFCSNYGCPISARVGALAPLRRALRTGRVLLHPETTVTRVNFTGRRATGVSYLDPQGNAGGESADLVVLAASAIETSRLALLSGLPDASGRIGARLMFHNFVDGFGIYLDQRVHAYRGRSITQCMEDFCNPNFPGARAVAKLAGLPYIRGGLCELGGSQDPITEGKFYQEILGFLPGVQLFGSPFKDLMRASLLRDRLAGVNFIGTDLPYLTNNVTLDPTVTDLNGQPVARVTWAPGKHEKVAQAFYLVPITAMMAAAGATLFAAVPDGLARSVGGGTPPNTKHVMGGMQMGVSPTTSVTDPNGRMHQMDNVYVADGSVFVTSGCQNPTNTLMAVALRTARGLTGRR